MAAVNKKYLLLLKKRILLQILLLRCKANAKRKYWVRKIYAERQTKGEYHLLVHDLRLYDQVYFFRCFRMSPQIFERLLTWVGPYITKTTTKMRYPVSAGERLCVTLRYLVTGDAQVTIACKF